MIGLTFNTNNSILFSFGALVGVSIVTIGALAHRCVQRWGKKDLTPSQQRIIERINILSDEILKRGLWDTEFPFVKAEASGAVKEMYAALQHTWPDALVSTMKSKLAEPAFQGKQEVLLDVLKKFVHDSGLLRDEVQRLAPRFNDLIRTVITEPSTKVNKETLNASFPLT